MRAFAQLYAELDATTSNNAKLAAMLRYFRTAPAADAAWGAYFLAGGKPRQLVPAKVLRLYTSSRAGIPDWLFEESYQAVGDMAETLALLLPPGTGTDDAGLAAWMQERLLPLRGLAPEESMARLDLYFAGLDAQARFVCAKLITGSMRVGVSRLLVTRALGELAQVDAKRVAERMIGYTDLAARPDAQGFAALIGPLSDGDTARTDGQPYPFFLAHPLALPTADMEARIGPPSLWQIEWKWDGIRAQLVRRGERSWVWSRGEELVTERFPELIRIGGRLPEGVVIDGEIVVWEEGKVQSFARLQQRLGRKSVGAKLLADTPVVLLAYDVLEVAGEDWRGRPQRERRAELELICERAGDPGLILSPLLTGADWAELDRQREASRALGVEGMMLKAVEAEYGVGRSKVSGTWWKWKVDPFAIDAVLIYAQRGHGRRASLYTDYTFAVWDGDADQPDRKLVPFAKAYSGLTDEEIRQVDAIVRKTTLEKFGPVRSLTPTLVFELGFEGIARSARHKSGVAVRFPRMLRWRLDKTVAQADTLATLSELLPR
jgi:DNA ligase-1